MALELGARCDFVESGDITKIQLRDQAKSSSLLAPRQQWLQNDRSDLWIPKLIVLVMVLVVLAADSFVVLAVSSS